MKKLRSLLIIGILCFISIINLNAQLHISTNTTWSTDQVVTQSIVVDAGATLTINEGVKIEFIKVDGNSDNIGDFTFTVEGTLISNGTEQNKVRFTSYESTSARNDWTGIIFNSAYGETPSSITGTDIEYAYQGIQVDCGAAVSFANTTVRMCGNYGMYIIDGPVTTDGFTSTDNSGYGVRIASDSLLTLNNLTSELNGNIGLYIAAGGSNTNISCFKVKNNSGHGVYISNTAPNLTNGIVSGNTKHGIYLSGPSTSPTVTYTDVSSNTFDGFYFKDAAKGTFTYNNIVNNHGYGAKMIQSSTPTFNYNNIYGNDGIEQFDSEVYVNSFSSWTTTSAGNDEPMPSPEIPYPRYITWARYSMSMHIPDYFYPTYTYSLSTRIKVSGTAYLAHSHSKTVTAYTSYSYGKTLEGNINKWIDANSDFVVDIVSTNVYGGNAHATMSAYKYSDACANNYQVASKNYSGYSANFDNNYWNQLSGVDTLIYMASNGTVVKNTIEAFAVPTAGAEPDILVDAISCDTLIEAGYLLDIQYNTVNQGADCDSTITKYYLSSDNTYNAGDTYLGSQIFGVINAQDTITTVDALTIPGGTSMGQWYIIIKADANDEILECNETDNIGVIGFNIRGPWPDHTMLEATVTPTIIDDGGTIDITCEPHNIGTQDTFALVHYYLSDDVIYDAGDVYLGKDSIGDLLAGDSAYFSNTLTIPVATPHQLWYILFFVDPVDSLTEVSEVNNLQYIQISVETLYADLVVNNPALSNSVIPRGSDLNVTCDVTNQGTKDCGTNTLKYYLSSDQLYDGGDVELDTYSVGGLVRDGDFESVNDMVTIPIGTTTGTWYLLFYADAPDLVEESDDLNNVNYITIEVIDPVPVLALGNDTVICDGNTMMLDAGGGYDSYLWSTGLTTQTISINSSDTYSVTVTNSGYEQQDTIILSPQTGYIDLGGDVSICSGETHTIDAGTYSGYLWSDNSTFQTLDVTTTGLYAVTVTDVYSCESADTINVTVNSLPVISFSGNTSICEGETATITASGGTLYDWSSGQTAAAINVNPSSTTSYTVTVTDGNGCENSDNVTVTVNLLPTAEAGAEQTICEGETTMLTATGGATYEWSTTETTASIDVSPTITTSYIVTVTSVDGCDATDQVIVNVSPLPDAGLTTDTMLCSNGSTIDMYTLLSGTPDIGGTWINSSGTSVNNMFDPTSQAAGVYSYIVSGGGICDDDTTDLTISIIANPVITINGNNTFCFGEGTYLSSNYTDNNQWYFNSSPIAGADSMNYYPDASGSYTVENTQCNLTSAMETIQVYYPTIPVINANGPVEFCDGGNVILASDQTSGNLWSNGETAQFITADTSGFYYITYVDGNGCIGISDTIEVIVHDLPPVPIITEMGGTLVSSAGTGNQWYLDGSPIIGETGQFHSPTVSGAYQVEVTNAYGCSSMSDTITVIIDDITEIDVNNIQIYPNPTEDYLYVKTNSLNQDLIIELYDIDGKMLEQKELQNKIIQFDLSRYSNGNYLLKVSDKSGKLLKSRKIVKK